MKDGFLEFSQTRVLVNFDYVHTAPETVELYVKKYLKAVSTSKNEQLLLTDVQNITKSIILNWTPYKMDEPIRNPFGDLLFKIFPKSLRQVFLNSVISSRGSRTHYSTSDVDYAGRVIYDLFRNEPENKVYGQYLNFSFREPALQSDQLSVAIYCQHELDLLLGQVSKKKTEVVGLGPTFDGSTGKSTKVLTDILERIVEHELRTSTPFI